jgi:hypothetical protein
LYLSVCRKIVALLTWPVIFIVETPAAWRCLQRSAAPRATASVRRGTAVRDC